MSSARPASTSSVVQCHWFLLSWGCARRTEDSLEVGVAGSGQNHDLGAEHEAGAEADLQGEPAAESDAPRAAGASRAGWMPPTCCRSSRCRGAITTDSGSFSCLANSSMMRMFAWWGMKAARSDASTPGGLQRLLGDLGHLPDGPAEDRLALLAERRPRRPRRRGTRSSVAFMPTASAFEPSEPQTVRSDAGRVARADDDRAGAVAEQERDAAVGRVDDVARASRRR